jgi:hypothetical protein
MDDARRSHAVVHLIYCVGAFGSGRVGGDTGGNNTGCCCCGTIG